MHHANRRTAAAAILLAVLTSVAAVEPAGAQTGNQPPPLLSDLVDVSRDFRDFTNELLPGRPPDRLRSRGGTGQADLACATSSSPGSRSTTCVAVLRPFEGVTLPGPRVPDEPEPALLASQFVSPRTVRLRMGDGSARLRRDGDVAHARREPGRDSSWRTRRSTADTATRARAGSVTVFEKPWHVEFRDARGRLLTQHAAHRRTTRRRSSPALPVLVRPPLRRTTRAASPPSSRSSPGEKIFGCGESFTRLDKRGQKVVLWANDANGVADGADVQADPLLPEQPRLRHVRPHLRARHLRLRRVVPRVERPAARRRRARPVRLPRRRRRTSSTSTRRLTGKAAMPPLWSFGLWMSRITYTSEEEVRAVAAKLRAEPRSRAT